MRTVEERIEALERANRRYRMLLIAFGMTVVAAVGVSAAQDQLYDVVRSKKFEVVGDDGNVAVVIQSFRHSGYVSTFKASGQLLVHLGSDVVDGNERGLVATYNGDGQKMTGLSSNPHGAGAITSYNQEGQSLVQITSSVVGTGLVTTHDAEGKKLVLLTSNSGGSGGAVHVRNQQGSAACTLHVDQTGTGEVGAWAPDGNGRTLKPGK